MTVKLFIKWLQENFPEDAMLVTTNSLAWFSREVKRVKAEELGGFFFLKDHPEMNRKPVDKPCLVIRDYRHYDY